MPTKAELDALISNCSWTWTTKNGVKGYVVKGKNNYVSASIFLPVTGYGSGSLLEYTSSYGYYWSSDLYSHEDYTGAYTLDFIADPDITDTHAYRRFRGHNVRPVRDAN